MTSQSHDASSVEYLLSITKSHKACRWD